MGANLCWLIAELETSPLFQRLAAEDRMKVLLGFAAIVALGGAAVWLILIGGRITRQWSRTEKQRPPSWQTMHDDWASKPILPNDDSRE